MHTIACIRLLLGQVCIACIRLHALPARLARGAFVACTCTCSQVQPVQQALHQQQAQQEILKVLKDAPPET